ncbi:MAG: hypothetical protein ACOVOV_00715 [Dolichospermum sp.]
MADLISWPIGPLEGDIYSVNGKYWEWNGCAWVSTCCPGACSIYDTGITLGFTENIKWGPEGIGTEVTTKICFSYDAQTGTWNSESLNDNGDWYQITEDGPGVWDLNYMSLGNVKEFLGALESIEPIGSWRMAKDKKAETICGCPPIVCGCAQEVINSPCYNITFFPVSYTGVSGATVAYVDTENKFYFYYNTVDSVWELYAFGDATVCYTISLPITTVPIGDWTGSSSEFFTDYPYFSTSLGHCEGCIPYTDGIILAYTTDVGTPAQLTTYVPLTWNTADDIFENFDGTIYIEYNPAQQEWNLWINGSLEFSHQAKQADLLGFWDPHFTILCGTTSVTNTEGCLTATSSSAEPTTLYLQENTNGDFNYGYPFSQPTWQIICDGGVWSIQSWNGDVWVTEATVTAPCNTPPYDLTWTLDPGSSYDSFTFTEGPCPVLCNSYRFRSNNPDGTTISFKLCGCDETFYLRLVGTEISDIFCVQEDSIDLGAFGSIAETVALQCTPNLNQCYSMTIRNTSQGASDFTYMDCFGFTQTVSLQPDGTTSICGQACSINLTGGSIAYFISAVGCV